MNITASQQQPGDIVTKRPGVVWRVESVVGTTTTSIKTRVIYLHCDFSPERVGTSFTDTRRLTTSMEVSR